MLSIQIRSRYDQQHGKWYHGHHSDHPYKKTGRCCYHIVSFDPFISGRSNDSNFDMILAHKIEYPEVTDDINHDRVAQDDKVGK